MVASWWVTAFLTPHATLRSVHLADAGDDERARLTEHGVEFHDVLANDSLLLMSFVCQKLPEESN
jgi:hypothetical protein